jgi:hypothetical protein
MSKPGERLNRLSGSRRDLLRRLGAGTAGAAAALTAQEGASGPRKTIVADVLVIGGGTAGAIAAIQAARAGARTVLVEAGSQLGGTMTTGGVDFPGLFHAWGKQIIAGIGWDLVRAAVELNGGRQGLLRMMRFLKPLKGFENLRLERLQPETGVRETWRIAGETRVTVRDYTSGRRFDDAVAYSFYPIDLHDERGVRPRQLSEGTVATIPLSALIPKASRDLLVAGRCVSSDRLANSALRVQTSCMAMGQAAGAAAALAASGRMTPAQVPLAEVHKVLRQHGAIVPA